MQAPPQDAPSRAIETVLIVDDETLARSRLRVLLSELPQLQHARLLEASNTEEARRQLRSPALAGGVDLVLLDINMPGIDGMTLASEIRRTHPAAAVIFVTAHAQHALQAFDLDALDYLTKPVRAERLQQAIAKVGKQPAPVMQMSPGLIVQYRNRSERVPIERVLYCRAELKYVTIHTVDKEHIWDGTLSDLVDKHIDVFLRIHRNTLVARRFLRALERVPGGNADHNDGWVVRLQSVDVALTVSRRQVAAVRSALTHHTI